MSITKQKQEKKIRKTTGKKKPVKRYSVVTFAHYKKNEHPRYNTPDEIYLDLNKEFHFTRSRKKPSLIDKSWKQRRIFLNPPFREAYDWVEKGLAEMKAGHVDLLVYLLHGDLSTSLFHDLAFPSMTEFRAVRGRLIFNKKGRSPFGSVIVIFGKKDRQKRERKIQKKDVEGILGSKQDLDSQPVM